MAHFDNISWPSLYDPTIEVGFFGPPIRPGGYYISNLDELFRFILYWALIFNLPFNLVAGLYMFFNLVCPPGRNDGEVAIMLSGTATHARSQSQSQSQPQHARSGSGSQTHAQTRHARSQSQTQSSSQPPSRPSSHAQGPAPFPTRHNALRSRITFALLVFVLFLCAGVLSAVAGAAVLAGVIWGVYTAGGFYVSTWIPFVWAVVGWSVGLLGIWPTIVDII